MSNPNTSASVFLWTLFTVHWVIPSLADNYHKARAFSHNPDIERKWLLEQLGKRIMKHHDTSDGDGKDDKYPL